MSNYRSPQHTLNAFNRIENELPSLVGENSWPGIEDQYQSQMKLLRQSSDENERALLAFELIELFTPYPDALKRLDMEIELQGLITATLEPTLKPLVAQIKANANEVDTALTALEYVTQWSLDPDDLPDVAQIHDRSVTLHDGGLDGGKTIKIQNLEFDFEKMPQLASGMLLTIYGAFDKPHPLIIAAGILVTIASVVKAMTEELSEQETSVFWGMIEACGNNSATEAEILQATNNTRAQYGMLSLNEMQLLNSLRKLERLECIEQTQKESVTHWRIIEKYKIKN